MQADTCNHAELRCLNQFELIRKYKCAGCGAVMMCSCDEAIARRFLSHQLSHGTDLHTKEEIPVTAGFQPSVCRECHGLAPEAHPVASIHGRTTKIRRYYWRELAFREMELFADWADANGFNVDDTGPEATRARQNAARQALDEIKQLHERTPKYSFREETQADVIERYNVDVVDLKGTYLKPQEGKKAQILDSGVPVSPEEFARRHFSRLGYECLFVESVPFHVLFGTFMWLVVQDPCDPRVRLAGFGDRHAADVGTPGDMVWTHLPEDFGSNGYSSRRSAEIEEHFAKIIGEYADLDDLFEYWLYRSEGFRQYLWAHREKDIETARRLIEILPRDVICRVLRYLVDGYWDRFCGWPDLLVYNDREFFFAEVKASGDKLSDDQKNWIQGNDAFLKLRFVLVKIHKAHPKPA